MSAAAFGSDLKSVGAPLYAVLLASFPFDWERSFEDTNAMAFRKPSKESAREERQKYRKRKNALRTPPTNYY